MNPSIIRLIAILAVVYCVIPACSKEDDDDSSGSSDDDGTPGEVPEGAWVDPETNLMWLFDAPLGTFDDVEYKSDADGNGDGIEDIFQGKDYNQAKTICENIEYGGFDDWRLPTILEVRSLIQGCDATAGFFGSCRVTDECPDMSCFDQIECGGCDVLGGPNLATADDGYQYGYYLNTGAKISANYFWYWSSTIVPGYDQWDMGDFAWHVDFQDATIAPVPITYWEGFAFVCDRDWN